MADWDTNNPSDNDIASQYPANERAARGAVVTNFGVDHHETDDADVGKHEVIQFVVQGSAPTIAAGQVGIWNEGGVLKTRAGAGAVTDLGIEAGTKMVFFQASAPTGWTQDASVNDRVLRVVSGTGGGTGGSWTISGLTVAGHSLTIAQLPSHDHGGNTGAGGSHSHTASTGSAGAHTHTARLTDGDGGGFTNEADSGQSGLTVSNRAIVNSAGAHTHSVTVNSVSNHTHSIPSQGSGSSHNHGISHNGAWRPNHIDVIVATKD